MRVTDSGIYGGSGGSFDPTTVFDQFYWEARFQALSDDAPFTQLTDAGPNHNNATQATGSLQALNKTNQLNGLPTALFDGTDDFYDVITAKSGAAGFTLAFLVKGTGMIGGGTGAGTAGANIYNWLFSATSFNMYLGDGFPAATLTDVTAAYSLIVLTSSGTSGETWEVFQNGVSKGTGSDNSFWAYNLIGKYASGQFFNGHMALIGYTNVQADGDFLTNFTNYALDTYGLNSPVTDLRIAAAVSTAGRWQSGASYITGGSNAGPGTSGLQDNAKSLPGRPQGNATTVYGGWRVSSSPILCTVPNVISSTDYQIRLHALDNGNNYEQSIRVNGITYVPDYVVQSYAGAANTAGIQEFTAPSSPAGKLAIQVVPAAGKSCAFAAVEVHEPPPAQLPIQAFAFGDSITEGGAPTVDLNNRWIGVIADDPAYTANMPNHDWSLYANNYNETLVNNFPVIAQTGDKIGDQTAKIAANVTPFLKSTYYRVNAAIMMCGVNNLLNGFTDVQMIALYQAFFAALPAGITQRALSTILPSVSILGTPAIHTYWLNVNAWILANTLGLEFTFDPATNVNLADPSDTTYYNADGLHPNATGEAVLATIFTPFFAAL